MKEKPEQRGRSNDAGWWHGWVLLRAGISEI